VEERYPFMVSSELTREEIEESLALAEKMTGKIKRLIKS
jgi:hypothetical protein